MGLLGFYFLPTGRIPRSRFWIGFIGLLLIETAFAVWIGSTLGKDLLDPGSAPFTKAGVQLSLLINLIFIFPLFVVLAKRFHDRNKSAFWALPFPLAWAAAIAALVVSPVPMNWPLKAEDVTPLTGSISLIWLLLLVWTLIELGLVRGTRGVNRFGADPLA